MEDCLRDISAAITRRYRKSSSYDVAQHHQVRQILKNDGIQEGSELHLQAIWLCRNTVKRMEFFETETKAGRKRWIEFNWANK